MSIDVAVAIEIIKLALSITTISDISEDARDSAKPTNYKNKEVDLNDRTTFYFTYDKALYEKALNVIIDAIEQPITTEIKLDYTDIDMDKPMHFTPEQKAWVKKYIAINGERQRADAIDEMVLKLETNMPSKLDEKERYGYTVALSIFLEQLKEQK